MKPRVAAALLALGLVSLAAGLGAFRWWQSENSSPRDQAPEIVLRDMDGQLHSLSEWNGKLLLVNFWATWCAPCLKEIPLLVQTQQRLAPQGLQIVGIAMDQVEPVRGFAARLGINYPVLVGEAEVAAAMDALGDELGALPFSVLISPDGRILRRISGALGESELEEFLGSTLQFR